jgi:hypothetical protein
MSGCVLRHSADILGLPVAPVAGGYEYALPIPSQMAAAPQKAVETLAVELAATINPIKPVVDTIKTSLANIKTIAGQQIEPGPLLPILNAVGSNLGVYLSELPDLPQIFNQVLGNLKAAVTAPLDQNLNDPGDPALPAISLNTNNTEGVTCIGSRECGDNALTKLQTTGFLAYDPTETFASLIPFTNVLSSPLSGALLGFAGPGLSALAQVIDSFNVITTAFKAKNWAVAINEVINLPVNLINAGLNGNKNLDLTPIVDRLAPMLGINLPAGTKLGIATGGLLSPGVAMGGGSGPTSAPFGGWSGTAWDSVSVEADIGVAAYTKGLPVGTIATQLGMRTTIADAIRLPKPTSAQAVAPAAAAAEIEAAAPVADVPAVADADAAADAPAPKRKARAATRADNDGGKGNPARAGRAARNAN